MLRGALADEVDVVEGVLAIQVVEAVHVLGLGIARRGGLKRFDSDTEEVRLI
jgi:hypothetical protein